MSLDLSYREKIECISKKKHSRIIIALDIANLEPVNMLSKAKEIIKIVNKRICGVKINFHLILPLSLEQLKELNQYIHSFDLVSIADIKLNDIDNTNEITLKYLFKMGFDAAIVNPFIGFESLEKLTSFAHGQKKGIISLVYMSHPGALEGYGLKISDENGKDIQLYSRFLENSVKCRVDGIVVGATQKEIVKNIQKLIHPPIYSPGIGIQGGIIDPALLRGINYIIIGRSLINSENIDEKITEILRGVEF